MPAGCPVAGCSSAAFVDAMLAAGSCEMLGVSVTAVLVVGVIVDAGAESFLSFFLRLKRLLKPFLTWARASGAVEALVSAIFELYLKPLKLRIEFQVISGDNLRTPGMMAFRLHFTWPNQLLK